MNVTQPLLIDGPDWTCYFSPGDREKLVFKSSGQEIFSIFGMSFGKFDETAAYCSKSKKHEAIDTLNSSMETVNVLPFGSEPTVTRKCEIAGNHGIVMTDFDLRSKIELPAFEVDNLILKGVWSRIGVVRISSPLPLADDIRWHAVEEGKPFRLELDAVPLLLLFERNDGFRLEIGTGDDIWRWLNTSLFPGSSQSVVIEKKDGGISLARRLAVWSNDTLIIPRKYRFSWYFAWERPGMKFYEAVKTDDVDYFTFPEGDVPQQLAACCDGRNLGVSCFHSPAVSGIFRSLVRAALGSRNSKDLVIGNLTVPLCDTAAHLERPQRQLLMHWNMARIFDHWLWANKQLRNSGASFYAVPAKNDMIFHSLPSVRGLSEIGRLPGPK